MTGGRQLEHRREKLRELFGEEINLRVWNTKSEGRPHCFLTGELEFRSPDKGYFLKGTNAKIFVPYVQVNPETKYIFMNLSRSLIQGLENYMGVEI